MKFKEERKLSADIVRNLCIRYNWYTKGSCEEYSELLNSLDGKEMTTDELVKIAENIKEHSETEDGTGVEEILFELDRRSMKRFTPAFDEKVLKELQEHFVIMHYGKTLETIFQQGTLPIVILYPDGTDRYADENTSLAELRAMEREYGAVFGIEKILASQKISIKSKDSKLCAMVNKDPLYPGISVYYENEDGDLIDVVQAEINPETQDVSIYVYGNVFQEDYTQKIILAQEDIVKSIDSF